ncbi:MAG: hypothetical protein IKM59_01040 [Oscillospiraceae bacterium]|nr:hypothetical protein [Oscillospiraceae bacterium]
MPRVKLAEFIVEFQNQYPPLGNLCHCYLYDGPEEPQFVIRVTEAEMKKEAEVSSFPENPGYLETICAYRQLCMQLPPHGAMLLHASCIEAEGRGIAFFARSGVGKTTHTRHWIKTYFPKVNIVNGDKPILRFFDGVPYAYGTPWAGKEGVHRNVKVPLRDLCLIERSTFNEVTPLSKEEALNLLMLQIFLPPDPQATLATLDMLEKLLETCNLWRIRCTPEKESAILAHDTILAVE